MHFPECNKPKTCCTLKTQETPMVPANVIVAPLLHPHAQRSPCFVTALDLYREATRRGLHLEPRDGDKLAVIPGDLCPPDFADMLRQHKRELLDLLETERKGLPADCAPWLHIARQVMAGEFDGADRSTAESLTIGLRRMITRFAAPHSKRLHTHSAKP